MRTFIKLFFGLLFFILLTILTQIGGIVFLISIFTFGSIDKRLRGSWMRVTAKSLSFLVLYPLVVSVIVPLTAKPFGRVPLPLIESNHVQPANVLTVLLCRNYVRPELRQATYDVAQKMNAKYPGTTLNYLDANFPFIDGFPLQPHLSHSDGKKLDVSFHYVDAKTGKQINKVPSWIGYGVCEEPRPGEFDRPAYCTRKGYWQYSFLQKIVAQHNKDRHTFDPDRTKDLVNYFVNHKSIGKLLIEPHLKTRLRLTSSKVRLHGCHAVRHDDHIHVQLK